jgi:uncharacterized circularly permuted ATP-grasp superfamily protein
MVASKNNATVTSIHLLDANCRITIHQLAFGSMHDLPATILHLPSNVHREMTLALVSGLREAGIHFEGRPYPAAIEPLVLSQAEADQIIQASVAVHGVLERVAELYRSNQAVRDFFPRYQNATRWISVDNGLRPDIFVCRLDGVLIDGQYRVMETNAACPGGVIQTGMIHRIWHSLVKENLDVDTRAFAAQPTEEDPRLFVRRLIDLHRRRTGARPETAAVVMLNGNYRNEVDWISRGLTDLGTDTVVADATDLTWSGTGPVTINGARVDLTYNKLDQVELIGTPEAAGYLDAAAAGAVTFVNGLLAQCVLEDKSVLALLTDDRFAGLFASRERKVIDEHIPWTRRVVPGVTAAPDGTQAGLFEYLSKDRNHLVIKPTDKTRGEGVVIGSETTPGEWEAAIAAAASTRGGFVAQTKLPLSQSWLRRERDGQAEKMVHGIDTYLFDGQFASFHVRASLDPVINIGHRGRLMPVLIEKPGPGTEG